MAFSTNYSELAEIMPEGVFEALITTATEETDQQGRSRLSFVLTMRNDVQQECQNRVLYHSIYKSKEPKPIDAQVANYSFASIMRIASAAKLPENKNYNTLAELMNDLANRPVKVEVYHDEYNGKKSARVKYWNPTELPEVHHQMKAKSVSTSTYAQPTQAATAQPLPWVQ